ncbi:hypothetical protein C7S18_05400 [Ahniella affigens]|uniref:Peptidase M56 domain-containing protein n=1 Tax=Ahniella affigens TaxID=2021234 RepID=A0A2P1PPA9_9GAMM|nr:M56 family metallopeptidase [Ahniella affigens]AVP96672.1 hypothetical protein C7S18_05400 [Ahniella affigens]
MFPDLLKLAIAFNVGLLIVLLLRPLWHRSGAPATVYGLWLLPVLLALATCLPKVSVMPTVVVPLEAAPSATVTIAGSSSITSLALVACVLAQLGSVLLLGYLMARHMRFTKRLGRTAGDQHPEWPEAQVFRANAGPALTGFWRPSLVLPPDFETRFSTRQQALAVAHERAHWRAGDLPIRWFAWLCVVLQWWNPLAWWALNCFINDQELANDARVLRACPDASLEYAQTLALAQTSAQAPLVCAMQTTHPLLWRVTMLKHHAANSALRTTMRLSAGLILLGLTGLTLALDTTQAPSSPNNYTVMVSAQFPGQPDAAFALAGPMGETMSARLGEQADAVALEFTVTRTSDPSVVLVSTRATQAEQELGTPTLLLPLGQAGGIRGTGEGADAAGSWSMQITVQKGLPGAALETTPAAETGLPKVVTAPWQDKMFWTKTNDPGC